MQKLRIARLDLDEINPRQQYLLLAGITFMALVLRLYRLGEWSFWEDEYSTVISAPFISDWPLTHLPIYLVLIRIALDLLGTSEWSARIAPALIGVLTIPAIYFPVRRIFGISTALIASIMLSLSPWHLYWSQNARFYTLVLLLYSLSLFTFYLGMEQRKTWLLLLSIILFGLAARERLFNLFLVPIFAAYLLLEPRLTGERSFALKPKTILSLAIPTILIILILGWRGFFGLIEHFNLYSGLQINSPFWIFSGVLFYLGIPLVCAGAIGMVYLISQRNKAGLLLGISAFVPLASTVFLANFVYTGNRYVFVTLTSWTVLASAAISELIKHTEAKIRWLAIMPLVIILLAYSSENLLYYMYQHGNRANWKAAIELVQEQKQPGDLVATGNKRIADYYMKEQTLNIKNIQLEELERQGARVWIIEDIQVSRDFPGIHVWIIENSRFVADFSVQLEARNFLMKVFLYEPENLQN